MTYTTDQNMSHSPPTHRPTVYPTARDAVEGKEPQRRPEKRLGRRLEEVVRAVRGGYCRLQMPLRLAFAVRETVAGHRLGALEWGGAGFPCFTSFSRPKGACGTADEDFVLLSLRACLSQRATHKTPHGGYLRPPPSNAPLRTAQCIPEHPPPPPTCLVVQSGSRCTTPAVEPDLKEVPSVAVPRTGPCLCGALP